jgi:hypothetical protein
MNLHDEVNRSEFLDTPLHRIIETINGPHVDSADSYHLCPRSSGGDILGDFLGFLDVPSDDTRVGAQMNESADLRAADGAGSASAEDDLVC